MIFYNSANTIVHVILSATDVPFLSRVFPWYLLNSLLDLQTFNDEPVMTETPSNNGEVVMDDEIMTDGDVMTDGEVMTNGEVMTGEYHMRLPWYGEKLRGGLKGLQTRDKHRKIILSFSFDKERK